MAVIGGERQARFHGKTLPNISESRHPSTGGGTFSHAPGRLPTAPRRLPTAPGPGLMANPGRTGVVGGVVGDALHALFHGATAAQSRELDAVARRQNAHPPSLFNQLAMPFTGMTTTQAIHGVTRWLHPGRALAAQRGQPLGGVAGFDLGSGGRLPTGLRDRLTQIANSAPSDAEQLVQGSKLGIAHHGTPYPFDRTQIMPHGEDPLYPPSIHLSPDETFARAFAAVKAGQARKTPVLSAYSHLLDATPIDALTTHNDMLGAVSEGIKNGQLNSKSTLGEAQLPNGEPLIRPRVHSFFVDARNPIHLQDVPNPGALELIKQAFSRRSTHGGPDWRTYTSLLDRLDQHKSYESLFKDLHKTLGGLVDHPDEYGGRVREGDVRHWMTQILQKHVGADAVVGRAGNIQVSSPYNLWDPRVVDQAQGISELRAHAAELLAHDQRGRGGANLDPQLAVRFAQALREGKFGPLRQRILLKRALDTPGVGTPYYRGTASVYKRENPQFWNEHSLHGPGAYATDSNRVADSYVGATNGDAREGGNIRLVSPVSGEGGLLNLDKEIPDGELILRVRDAVQQLVGRRSRLRFGDNGAEYGKSAASQFLRAMQEGGSGGRFNPTGQEMRDWLDYHHGPDLARQILAKAGVKVLEHEGGQVIGGLGSHNVRIGLKPSAMQPHFRVRGLLQGYVQALKALQEATGMHGASAEERAAYLRSYAKTFADETAIKGQVGGTLMEPHPAELKRTLEMAKYLYPEIKREFGNEGVMLFARGFHSGLFEQPRDMQIVANNLIEQMKQEFPPVMKSTTADVKQRQMQERRDFLNMLLRSILEQRHGDKLDTLFPGGGFPY